MENETVKLKTNQNGGAREGAGRKAGSGNKLRVTDFFNGEEREELIANAKLLAFGDLEQGIKPDKDMIKFCWEQLFGKAIQQINSHVTMEVGEESKALIENALKDI